MCHLELYTILWEYDNAGFPLSYCLLTTATAIEDGKCTRALQAWATVLHDKYGVVPRFVHMDKDMAEIGASLRVWPLAKHQLCWWHQREAVKRRLKGNLPTLPYNAECANGEHAFIDTRFKPVSRMDPNDIEGGVPGEECEPATQEKNTNTTALVSEDPDTIKIRIPISHLTCSSQTICTDASRSTLTCGHHNSLATCSSSATDVRESVDGLTLASGHAKSFEDRAHSAGATKFTIRIPAASTIRILNENEPNSEEETTARRHTFCPIEHRETVVALMERHFCTHPLIPGYSVPKHEHIKAWAVKQMYDFCTLHDLPNLWAYLWENWYRCGRWELWARSANPCEIPRLKTTMLVEAQ